MRIILEMREMLGILEYCPFNYHAHMHLRHGIYSQTSSMPPLLQVSQVKVAPESLTFACIAVYASDQNFTYFRPVVE